MKAVPLGSQNTVEFTASLPFSQHSLCPYGVASRSCCATQGSVGERVTLTWMIFRDFSEGDEESKERTEEEIRHLHEITGPDVFCVIAQERFPALSTGACCVNVKGIVALPKIWGTLPD